MNKTIIININGIVFHIEEDAYEVLKHYMTDVKRHFMDSADSLEITTDIENRLAEMFSETLARDGKQVIAEQDVKSVIEQMGTVEDFEHAENGEDTATTTSPLTYKVQNRRLFRDADDHLIAGVCAGIANYFDIQTIWVRLAFAILSLMFASGIFLYIILWIVVPKAITRADRMAMKGEKLDLQGFKRNFEEEFNTVRGHVSTIQQEAKPFIYKGRDFAGDFVGHFGTFLTNAFKLVLKMFGIFILLTCFATIIGLIIAIVAFAAFGNRNMINIFPFNVIDRDYNLLFFASAFLLAALPLLTIILWIVRLIFDRATINRSSSLTLLVLWVTSLILVIYFVAAISADFKTHESFSQTISIKPTLNNTYYLKLNNARYISSRDSERLNIKGQFGGRIILDGNDDDDFNQDGSRINIRIEKSDIARPVLEESFGARGHNEADALANANLITYQFIQADSVLKFDRRLQKGVNRPWRNQEVNLTLRIPLNANVVIDRELNRYLEGINTHKCDMDGDDNDKHTSARFIMTNDGLQCKIDTAVKATDIIK